MCRGSGDCGLWWRQTEVGAHWTLQMKYLGEWTQAELSRTAVHSLLSSASTTGQSFEGDKSLMFKCEPGETLFCAQRKVLMPPTTFWGWLRLTHSASSKPIFIWWSRFQIGHSNWSQGAGKSLLPTSTAPGRYKADPLAEQASLAGLPPKQDDTSEFILHSNESLKNLLVWSTWKQQTSSIHLQFPQPVLYFKHSGLRINVFTDFRPAHLVTLEILQLLLQGKQLYAQKEEEIKAPLQEVDWRKEEVSFNIGSVPMA